MMKLCWRSTLRSPSLLRAGIAAMLATSLVLACGGGVGTGGTGGYASAVANGFGSVIVGGVEFDDTQALVVDDDGNAVTRTGSELGLGMTLEVNGSRIVAGANGQSSIATSIRIATTVLGPVEAVDPAGDLLTVLGQQVRTNTATVFGASLAAGLSALHPGAVVAVYAFPDSTTGSYIATRVEPAASAPAYRLRGIVGSVDSGTSTLTIGGATLRFATASGVPASLAAGQMVALKLAASSSTGPRDVLAFDATTSAPADAASAVLEGLVTGLHGNAQFTLNGLPVDASHASLATGSAPLTGGAYVSVSGQIVGGALVASAANVAGNGAIANRSFELKGPISSLSVGGGTFVVRNVTVAYAGAGFVGGSAATLANGETVQVTGRLATDGTQQIVAQQITLK